MNENTRVFREKLRPRAKGEVRRILPKTITIPAGVILTDAPKRIDFYEPHYDLIIGIGKDNIARLIIDADGLKALKELEVEPNIT